MGDCIGDFAPAERAAQLLPDRRPLGLSQRNATLFNERQRQGSAKGSLWWAKNDTSIDCEDRAGIDS